MRTIDQNDELPPLVVDRRRHGRTKVLFRGLAVGRYGTQTWDCLIKDISKTGAKLLLPEGQCIPEHFTFTSRRDKIARKASVQWVRAPYFGIQF